MLKKHIKDCLIDFDKERKSAGCELTADQFEALRDFILFLFDKA